jgi:hypothetical protein
MNSCPALLAKRKFSFDEVEECLEIFLGVISRSVRTPFLDWLNVIIWIGNMFSLTGAWLNCFRPLLPLAASGTSNLLGM